MGHRKSRRRLIRWDGGPGTRGDRLCPRRAPRPDVHFERRNGWLELPAPRATRPAPGRVDDVQDGDHGLAARRCMARNKPGPSRQTHRRDQSSRNRQRRTRSTSRNYPAVCSPGRTRCLGPSAVVGRSDLHPRRKVRQSGTAAQPTRTGVTDPWIEAADVRTRSPVLGAGQARDP